jgi:Protein of unknown function (DUF4232)
MKGRLAPGLAALAVLGLSACGANAGQSSASQAAATTSSTAGPIGTPAPKPPGPTDLGAVPWIATAYDPSNPTPIPGTVADPAVPWCTPEDIALSWATDSSGELSPWPGSSAGGWVLATNRSSTPCAVQGQPSVAVIGADDRDLTATPPSDPFFLQWWLRLNSGESATFSVQWSDVCDTPDGPYRLAIRLPRNSAGPLMLNAGSVTACSAAVGAGNGYGELQAAGFTPYVANANPPVGSQLPTPLNTLGFLLLGPSQVTAHAGAVFTYQVTVSSTDMTAAVSLNPCFGYRESLSDAITNKAVVSEMHLLNCAAIPTIPTNTMTEFDMEIAIPAGLANGTQLSLTWYSALGAAAYGNPIITID